MDWKNGKLFAVEIFSKAGNDCSLEYQGKSIRFKTEKGKRYLLDANLMIKK
jgi:alpha-L-fucosidase 2